MSLKDNLDMVKEELNSEEKFFEKAVVTEKFIKKYKNVMIGSFVVIVLAVGGNIAYDANVNSKIAAANEKLTELSSDSSNEAAQASLQTLSPALYDVWSYSNAVASKDMEAMKKLNASKTLLVNDLVSYELAQNSQDLNKLDSYSSNKSAIYKELAQMQSAIILLNDGKIDLAHNKLSMISETSPLYKVAKALLHYGIK